MKNPEKKSNMHKVLVIILMVVGIMFIGFSAILIFSNKDVSINGVDSSTGESNENDNDSSSVTDDSTKFTGHLSFEPRKSILDTFNVTVPEEFTSFFDVVTSLDKELDTNPSVTSGKCKVEFGEIINLKIPASDLAQQMAEYFDAVNGVIEKNINGITWYNFNYDFFGNIDAYLTERNNRLYLFRYTIEENASKDICSKYMPGIINSVSYK